LPLASYTRPGITYTNNANNNNNNNLTPDLAIRFFFFSDTPFISHVRQFHHTTDIGITKILPRVLEQHSQSPRLTSKMERARFIDSQPDPATGRPARPAQPAPHAKQPLTG